MLVPVVLDIFASSEPPFLVLSLLLKRVNAGHHAIVKQRIWFPHVDDVDLDACVFGRVVDAEIEPLGVALCVDVVLQKQVELIRSDLIHREKVA